MHEQDLKDIKEDKKLYILNKFDNAIGVGVSQKEVAGVPIGKPALTVYVEKKVPSKDLPKAQRIHEDPKILNELDGVEDLDIKVVGKVKALYLNPIPKDSMFAADATYKTRPVTTGNSEGHYQITAGTGGILVTDGHKKYRLSNNHVYANENKAGIDDPIYQPGPYDGGVAGDEVGKLHDFVHLEFDDFNFVDAALRTIQSDEENMVRVLNQIPVGHIDAQVGMTVMKVGRTTNYTVGSIIDVDASIYVGYEGGDVLFDHQIIITPGGFSAGGDSGSSVFTTNENGELLWTGLLFAGSEHVTIANHCEDVMNAFDVEMFIPENEPDVPDDDSETDEPGVPDTPEEPKNDEIVNVSEFTLIGMIIIGIVSVLIFLF